MKEIIDLSLKGYTMACEEGRVKKVNNFYVHEIGIRDFFPEFTLKISEFDGHKEWFSSVTKKWEDIINCFCAFAISVGNECPGLREEPRVCYDVVRDTYYFIFKINNNGTTYIVSEQPMPELYGENSTVL